MIKKSASFIAVLALWSVTLGAGAFAAPSPGPNLDQCANGKTGNLEPCKWQNGNLNTNNSLYTEGDGVPFRLLIDNLTPGPHSFHINYDFTVGGRYAYDILASYDLTLGDDVDVDADIPGGFTWPGGVADTETFPQDPFFDSDLVAYDPDSAIPAEKRQLTMFGGTITSIEAPTHTGSVLHNSSADLVVNFEVPGPALASTDAKAPVSVPTSTVAFLWSGHLAQGIGGWGMGLGAQATSGAPFHMRTLDIDGSGAKNQDRSIQLPALAPPVPDVVLDKTADDASVTAGEDIGFTITVANNGDIAATGVTISDTLPTRPGITWTIGAGGTLGDTECDLVDNVLSCNVGTLEPGAENAQSVQVTSSTTTASCGTATLDNTANATSTNDATIEPDSASITIGCLPDVVLLKTADDATVTAGDDIGFTITVRNNGQADATNVSVTDDLPLRTGIDWAIDGGNATGAECDINAAGTQLTCDFATVEPGEANEKTVHISSPTTGESCGEAAFTNEVTATADNDSTIEPADASIAIACIVPGDPDVSITKDADEASVVAPGTVGFLITVTNTGEGTAENVEVTDELPAGLDWTVDGGTLPASACDIENGVLTCDFGSVAPGAENAETVHIESSATTAATCAAGSVNNEASVEVSNQGPIDPDSASVTVTCLPLGLTVVKSGPEFTHVGDTVEYTINVTNSGSAALTSVAVTDPVCDDEPTLASGDGGVAGTLEVLETWVFTCDHLVTADDADPLPNTANVQAADALGRQTTGEDSHSVDVLHPSIALVKTVNPLSGSPAQEVTYTYVVTNTSTDTTLFDISLDDDILGHLADIEEIEPGGSVVVEAPFTLGTTPVTNIGTATGVDVTGREVTATDDARVTVVLGTVIARPDDPLPKTGAGLDMVPMAVSLLIAGSFVLFLTRRRREAMDAA